MTALAPTKSLSVLLVDDDDVLRAFLARVLREAGHAVIESDSGVAATLVLSLTGFDVVLADVLMSNGDGGSVLRAAASAQPSAFRIAMSGGGAVLEPRDCLDYAERAGAQATLAKPFTRGELLDLLATGPGGSRHRVRV